MSFWEGLEFRTQAEGWDEARKLEWILRQLRAVVRRAGRETAFYREHFTKAGFDPDAAFGFEDFARLPIVDREDVRVAGNRMFGAAVPAAQIAKDSTGGTSGAPTQIRTGPRERGWRESGMEILHAADWVTRRKSNDASLGSPPRSAAARQSSGAAAGLVSQRPDLRLSPALA